MTEKFDRLVAFIKDLPPEERVALEANLPAVKELAARLADAIRSIFTRTLDLSGGPGVISRLIEKGGPWGHANPDITDDRYPTSGTGLKQIHYRILRGVDLKRPDGFVYSVDVDAAFTRERMRRTLAAEALLVVAEDQQIGRGEHPLVAFIVGTRSAFIVLEAGAGRVLNLYSVRDYWSADCVFVGVCE